MSYADEVFKQTCIPQTRYAREYGYGLRPEDIMIANQLLEEIKEDINSKGVLDIN